MMLPSALYRTLLRTSSDRCPYTNSSSRSTESGGSSPVGVAEGAPVGGTTALSHGRTATNSPSDAPRSPSALAALLSRTMSLSWPDAPARTATSSSLKSTRHCMMHRSVPPTVRTCESLAENRALRTGPQWPRYVFRPAPTTVQGYRRRSSRPNSSALTKSCPPLLRSTALIVAGSCPCRPLTGQPSGQVHVDHCTSLSVDTAGMLVPELASQYMSSCAPQLVCTNWPSSEMSRWVMKLLWPSNTPLTE
mmetsp:Transcript_25253/g.71375  ORF Transcript_25253/g.71375 Transcript_25253/m.71375 type:complete len:249 (+) Transcript_25253:805-1551(+)